MHETPCSGTAQCRLQDSALLARRRSVSDWCDRHLMAIHTLSALMMDDPRVVGAALAELLSDPQDPLGPYRTPPRSAPARVPTPRDQCPGNASCALDRVELALHLIGDRTCATVSRTLGLSEHVITARLRSGLGVLSAACAGDAGYSSPGRRSTAATDHAPEVRRPATRLITGG